MAVAWSAFHPLIMPDLPGCPITSIDDALAASAEEFIARTKVWRFVVSGLSTQAGVREYLLSSVANWPANALLERVWSVALFKRDIRPTHESLVHANKEVNPDFLAQSLLYVNWYNANGAIPTNLTPYPLLISAAASQNQTALQLAEYTVYHYCGVPQHYAIDSDESIRFYPIPLLVEPITVVCAIKPSRFTATGVEQFIFDSYHEWLVSGAIDRLAVVPGKAWSNPDQAAFHKAKFESGIDSALTRDFHNTPVRSRLYNKLF